MTTDPITPPMPEATPPSFVGRSSPIDDPYGIIKGVTGDEPMSFAILGLRGFGKTTLLRRLEATLRERPSHQDWGSGHFRLSSGPPNVVPLYLNLGGRTGDDAVLRIYAEIKRVLEARSEAEFGRDQGDVISESWRAVTNVPDTVVGANFDELKDLARSLHLRVVLLLDDFDTAYRTITYDDELKLRTSLPSIPAVIATEEPWDVLKRDGFIWSPLFRYIPDQNSLKPLTTTEATDLLAQAGNVGMLDETTVNAVFELAGGVPRWILNIGQVFHELQLTGEEWFAAKINEDRRRLDQIVLRVLASSGLKNDCAIWWEQLTATEREVMIHLAQDSKRLIVEAEAIHRLQQWHLIREAETGYRISAELFAHYIRLFERMAHGRRHRETVDDRLLAYLEQRPGILCPYPEVLKHVWGDEVIEGRRLENALNRLRKRLGRNAIETIYGKGIRYTPSPAGENGVRPPEPLTRE